MDNSDRDIQKRINVIRRAFNRHVNIRYADEPVDLARVQRAKQSYDQIIGRLLAMHDKGECIMIAVGCPCCGRFNPDTDITELEPADLTA